MRDATVKRTTNETSISLSLTLDGQGMTQIKGPLHFFNHMLSTFARHGLFDIKADLAGDVEVDGHHLVEDTGLVLGEAFSRCLGERRGILRAGFSILPMDETLVLAAVDLAPRPYLHLEGGFGQGLLGQFPPDLTHDFFQAFVTNLRASLHLKVLHGRSDHHKVEALFKGAARALRQACSYDTGNPDDIPSTKGVL